MCKSNMNDEQGKVVIDDGQSFQFGFNPSPFLKIWYCELSYMNYEVSGRLYQYPDDWRRCFKHCNYTIARDGVHRHRKDGSDEVFLNWERPYPAWMKRGD